MKGIHKVGKAAELTENTADGKHIELALFPRHRLTVKALK